MRLFLYWLFVSLFVSINSFSQLRLPSVLSPGMVLQQNDWVTFWGWGYNGQQVKITGSWDNTVTTGVVNNNGKWNFPVKTPRAGGPYTITVNSGGAQIVLSDVMIGEVWLCSGQSNMEWNYYGGARYIKEEFPTCYNRNIRFFQVPRAASDYPQDNLAGEWKICDSNSLRSFSAVGYFFGKKLQHDLNVPIGLINSSWGGTPAETWTPVESINSNDTLKKAADELQEVPWGPVKAGLIYNGMIAPITKFNIAGAIWYQGEANVGANSTYARLLATMIDSWRSKWNKDFSFYFVQIAPYKYGNKNVGALLQEQQTKLMNHPNSGMVVITDLIDSVTNIHPSDKRFVGSRLANWALAEAYDKNTGPYISPLLKTAEVTKERIVLSFSEVPNGIIARGKTITGFFISGEKEEWLPAEAKIENNKIIVWNKNLKQPVYVRYGFGNTIIGNVFSKEGLPMTPFRTDNWPVDQGPEKN
ncbi:MAG TPA: sialate O-acetylesterase [Chitinophagaceae bacterium]|nr:sialate O-acetylesterase [Chitinophagaceae bacterium]